MLNDAEGEQLFESNWASEENSKTNLRRREGEEKTDNIKGTEKKNNQKINTSTKQTNNNIEIESKKKGKKKN